VPLAIDVKLDVRESRTGPFGNQAADPCGVLVANFAPQFVGFRPVADVIHRPIACVVESIHDSNPFHQISIQ